MVKRFLAPVGALLTGLLIGRRMRSRQTSGPVAALRASSPDGPLADQGRSAPARDLPEPDANEDTKDAPDPEDPSKPDSPTDLSKRSVLYVLRKTLREFGTDQCTDLAAALTYYAVLSLFPALVVVVSLLGVFGQGQRTTDAVLQIVGDLGPASAVDTLRAPIQQLVESPSAGFALIVGIGGALWSASGYVGAFGRAMNRIYEVEEGRPVWKLRPIQLVLTLVGLAGGRRSGVHAGGQRAHRCSNRRRHRCGRGSPDCVECRALAVSPDIRDLGSGRVVLLRTERQTAKISLDQHRRWRGDPGVGPCVGGLWFLRRQFR